MGLRTAQPHLRSAHPLYPLRSTHHFLPTPEHSELAEAHVKRRALEGAILLSYDYHIDRPCYEILVRFKSSKHRFKVRLLVLHHNVIQL